MKTKGLNFLEAVQAMKQGKKVRRSIWYEDSYIYSNSASNIMRNDSDSIFNPVIDVFEATDWEVVDDDKDWNLGETSFLDDSYARRFVYHRDDVKKCRDLIIQEVNKDWKSGEPITRGTVVDIVNKRFGDLK